MTNYLLFLASLSVGFTWLWKCWEVRKNNQQWLSMMTSNHTRPQLFRCFDFMRSNICQRCTSQLLWWHSAMTEWTILVLVLLLGWLIHEWLRKKHFYQLLRSLRRECCDVTCCGLFIDGLAVMCYILAVTVCLSQLRHYLIFFLPFTLILALKRLSALSMAPQNEQSGARKELCSRMCYVWHSQEVGREHEHGTVLLKPH